MDQSKTAAVADHVRGMIHSGALAAGDTLPSTRALAAQLGVARGTVVAAYEQLDGEGYLRTRQGALARVAPGLAQVAIASSNAPAAPSVPPPTLLDATPGTPAVTAISARDWRAAWRAAAALPLVSENSPELGTVALREQIAAQLGLSRGFAPGVERVLLTAGTSDAISLVTEALRVRLGRAPRIAVEDPGYPSGRAAITSAGGVVVPVPVGADGLELDILRRQQRLDAVMLTPTHQYPLGSVMPVARRRELLQWAAASAVVVIEDDYDSEFRHRGQPVPALAARDAEGVVVHVGGFSKILDPRLRCAYVVLPTGAVADAVVAARTARGPAVAEPVQAALTHLLHTGALRRHLGRVRRDYAHKRERIAARLAAASVPGLAAAALGGGLHVVLTWQPSPTGAEVVRRLAVAGIAVAALDDYAATEAIAPRLNGIVVGYGAVSATELDRVMDAVFTALADEVTPLR